MSKKYSRFEILEFVSGYFLEGSHWYDIEDIKGILGNALLMLEDGQDGIEAGINQTVQLRMGRGELKYKTEVLKDSKTGKAIEINFDKKHEREIQSIIKSAKETGRQQREAFKKINEQNNDI